MEETAQSNYKIGVIYKRSKILKSWNKRSIVLNYIKGTLSLRKGKAAKEKVILLENYEVQWVGKPKKSKVYYFNLKAVKDISSQKYKRVIIGDVNEQNAHMWMEEVEKIIDKNYIVQAVGGLTPYQLSQKQKELSLQQNGEQKKNQVYQKNGMLGVPPTSQFMNNQGGAQNSLKNDIPLNGNNVINLNGKKNGNGNGRQVVNINKEEDYDELIKQFESCCQYGENNADEYDERKPNERGLFIPNFNVIYNIQFMPDTIQDNPGIESIYENAPESIKEEVQQVLEGYYKKRKHFLEALYAKVNCEQIEKNLYKNEDNYVLVQEVPDMKPIEVYEEIQTPSTNEHWNSLIGGYQLQPASQNNNETRNLSLISFNFKYDKGENKLVDKDIVSYRYSIQFANAYFIWEFWHLSKQVDKSIESELQNKMQNLFIIFPDPQNNNSTMLIIRSKFTFQNEDQKQQGQNIMRFLKGFETISKCLLPLSIAQDIIVECNAEQEDGDNADEVDSQVFISIRIDRPVTTGNAEDEYTVQQIDQILEKIEKKSHINECIKAKHEMRIVSGIYQVVKSTKEKGHYCWKHDYRRDEKKGGLTYHNEKLMKEQKAVIMMMIKRIGSNILNGRGIMNISMPVQVFDSKSMIQRLAKGFGHAPNFLEKGGLVNSSIEQIKYTASFLLSSFIMGFNQEKPFNPIIGETVQARLNGCPIYFEQTSHHPPISNYYLYGRGYDLYGCHIPLVNMGANSLTGLLAGNPTVYFKNTQNKVYAIWNSFNLFNTAIGQRSLNCFGRAYVWEPKSNLVLELIYNPNGSSGLSSLFSKKSVIDEVSGAIYKVKPHVIKMLQEAHKPMAKKGELALDLNNDVLQLISKAEGIWCRYLEFDGMRYWDDSKDFPYMCEYEMNPLPSDSRYRYDLLYFQKNDKKKSQDMKEEMEEAQRYDQKIRDLGKKNRKKQ
ncbi:oxysterol-binding protein (macronuclear) [Tetrahymena thermophila SB210]|uniref:Oxysterol-binding protein n=1 Tax=Tetrahymena thermophila (strain SB210) TaxID=312017 RepID=I7MJQ9_TETTS|nr:oxysterol-binding protein [Tetrahymena thermophila SB210]EAS07102.1 oxysterol-binding protein [Tetrahymena thermophila SB210]|eukprot:XP_001027344.1 oxysterol-binding protein [Tetrahymena thermophila SB210]